VNQFPVGNHAGLNRQEAEARLLEDFNQLVTIMLREESLVVALQWDSRGVDFLYIFLWDFFLFCSYNIHHCFICRPSDSTVPTDAGIEPRTVATCALTVRR
jgi:hypothetical protein